MTVLLESIDIIKIMLPCRFQVLKFFSLGHIRVTGSKPMDHQVSACDPVATLDDIPPNQGNNLTWCICGRCRNMDHPNELVLQRDVLSIVIVHRSDTFGDDPEYTIRSYWKAAYCQEFMATWIPGKGRLPGNLILHCMGCS